ncbi:exo-beta-N-acetylmuramidase NamZ family protein, partial [Gottfriedia acidiceleris]|uniref:exo-beta-N-acetylmuramidase NamZ family protein n=1 Tax=Gottfriedia acidiceleris TaxID=371036 RepID=UPI003B587E32
MILVLCAWPIEKDVSANKKKNKVTPGIEVLLDNQKELLKGKKVGLITNPTGIDSNLNSIVDLLYEDPAIELTALFGPEHSVRGDAQAGSYVESYIDDKTGLPVYSLYGKTNKPTAEILKNVDLLLFDIQDVGTRHYTYIYTMAYALEAAKENNIPIVVLDRPNPLGGLSVDGPVLESDSSSFIGMYPIPTKHGMTVGELATFFNKEYKIGADLKVVKMKGWKRSMDYNETGLPFVLPSPNMPTVSTTFIYPATGLIEGTNVSEGRGTTKPFEIIGAPFINGTDLASKLNALRLPGVKFRQASFIPTFSKHAGILCNGVEIYVTDREKLEAVSIGLHIIKTIHDMYPNDFEFLSNNFFDKLIGNDWIRPMILDGDSVTDIMNKYQKELDEFKKVRKKYLMYK